MFRVAFKLGWHPAPRCAEDVAPLWSVTKCYDLRHGAGFAIPVKVDRDHGRDRQRLLVLSPERIPVGSYVTPYEALQAYLLALPLEVKLAREVELRGAQFDDPTHPAPYTERAA